MKLPLLSGKQVVKTLERLGFVEIHRKGSHVKMKHNDGRLIVFRFTMRLTDLRSKVLCAIPKFRLKILLNKFASFPR